MGWRWGRGSQKGAASFCLELESLLHTSFSLLEPTKGECFNALFSRWGMRAFGFPGGQNLLNTFCVPGTVMAVINYNNYNINFEHLLSTISQTHMLGNSKPPL